MSVAATDVYTFRKGDLPLLVSMPHVGTHVPPEIAARFTPAARPLPDTDWHVDRLYDFLDDLDATVIAATHSRYVVDLNRPPDNRPLYPGASNTGLCPVSTFDDEPIYAEGEPDAAEIDERRKTYWRPYHERLSAALEALRTRHGVVVLWDAHSIRSRVPRFFDGRLPDLNIGTADGASAAPALTERIAAAAAEISDYSSIVNGRFKGGYITRAYGAPKTGAHAVQLELSQITYMDEDPPYGFRDDLAARVRPVLRRLLTAACDWVG